MGSFAHQIVDPTHLCVAPVMVDHAVTELIFAERPQNAFVGFEGQGVLEKLQGFAAFCHSFCVNPKEG
jgi:hypothetical protein